MTGSVVGQRRSPKARLASENSHGHCLVVCSLSDPLQFSESQQSHYIWEVCSANWWDTLKTATPAAGIGQQNRPNSSPWHSTTHYTTNTSFFFFFNNQHFKSWMNWATKFCLIRHILLTSHQLTATSSSILTTFLQENVYTISRRQKILSRSSLNSEAWIVML